MPRVAREKSETGIYHVILRGIDKNDIFHENADYQLFLYAIKKAKEKDNFSLYAYCLMTNHVHILIKEGENGIGESIKRIAISYAQIYNSKYERVGHVFQDRFKSEPVDSDAYFLTVLRYIVQNPIMAGIVKNIQDYEWSSINKYSEKSKDDILDKDFVTKMFKTKEQLINYLQENTSDQCIDYVIKYTDYEINIVFVQLCEGKKFTSLSKQEKSEIILNLRKTTNAKNAQISRVTGLSRGITDRIISKT